VNEGEKGTWWSLVYILLPRRTQAWPNSYQCPDENLNADSCHIAVVDTDTCRETEMKDDQK